MWLPAYDYLATYLITTDKIKLEVPGSVNKCHMVHIDMAGGDSADVCNCSTSEEG